MSKLPENQTKQIIPEETKKDIIWWEKFPPDYHRTSMLWLYNILIPDTIFATDASLQAAGGVMHQEFFHVEFPWEIKCDAQNIAQLEILAIVLALKLWTTHCQNKVIRIFTDNQIALWAINKGKSKDKFILKCIREIAWISAKNQILLKAAYIETKQNTLPDLLSRWYHGSAARRKFKQLTNASWKRKSITKQFFQFQCEW